METIISKNRMSLSAFIEKNGEIEIIKSPKTGKLFFTVANDSNFRGYVPSKVSENLDSLTKEDLQYAECSIDGGQSFVPTIMRVGSKENIVKTFA